VSDDPLGELEQQLVAAARRRSRALGALPPSQPQALSSVLAVAFAGFAVLLVLGVLFLLAGH
jgi:hypothetical protein